MGVPKLWAFINQRNLGDKRSFPQRNVSHREFHLTHLIFDGPSFAYWLWKEASIKQGMDSGQDANAQRHMLGTRDA